MFILFSLKLYLNLIIFLLLKIIDIYIYIYDDYLEFINVEIPIKLRLPVSVAGYY